MVISVVNALSNVASGNNSAAASPNSAPAKSVGGDGTGPVATQLMQWVHTVADGSGASAADKANALTAIFSAIGQKGSSGGPSDNSYFQQTTLAQRQSVSALISSSSFAQQTRAAYQQFANQANALNAKYAGSDIPPSDSVLVRLNQLNPDQQQLVFAGSATGFASLDDWKAQLQKDQDTMAAQYAADSGGAAAVTVTLSNNAKTALAQLPGASSSNSNATSTVTGNLSSAAQALKTRSNPAPSDGIAQAALAVLTTAETAITAEANNATSTASKDSTPGASPSTHTQKTYTTGSKADTSA